MKLLRFEPIKGRSDAHTRVYRCDNCNHQVELTIWALDASEGKAAKAIDDIASIP